MAVKIRLKRMGKIRAPFYRVVVADGRTKRNGRAIEEIGRYVPAQEPSLIEINSERVQYWLSVGAQPTEQVAALLKVTGDWQKFKGEAGAEGTLRTAEPRADKKALYEAALAAADGTEVKETPTSKAKKDEKPAAKADKPKADKAEEPKADKAEEPKADKAETDGGFGPDSAAPTADGSAPEGFSVKGNKDSMKFHVEGSQWYDATEAEVWFRTAEAATAAGFEPAGGAAKQSADAGAAIGTDKAEG